MKNTAAWKQKLVRPASRAVLGGFRPPEDPLVSWFGRVLVAEAGESWPLSGGKPMTPLLQIRASEAPFVPKRLSDFALITLFLDADRPPSNTPNGEGWALRAYRSVEGLVPLERPAGVKWPIKPMPIRWEAITKDYPCWDDVANMDLPAGADDGWEEKFPNASGTRLGGWPTLIQSEISWAPGNAHPANPEFVLQIDSEEKARWNLGGVLYIGRGTGDHADEWVIDWQLM